MAGKPPGRLALRRRGLLERETGDEAAAEHTLEGAFFLAVRHDLDDVAAGTACDLANLLGEGRAQPAEGRRWAEHASAHADATGKESLQALVLHVQGGIALNVVTSVPGGSWDTYEVRGLDDTGVVMNLILRNN